MNDQKHDDTATTEGMPEAPPKAPPVDNDHVAPGAEQFGTPRTATSSTALEVEVQHLRGRLHDLEEATHSYLSRQTSVGHEKITSWLEKVKAKFSTVSTKHEDPVIIPPSLPADSDQVGSSSSKTAS